MAYNREAGKTLRSDLLGTLYDFDPSLEGFVARQVLPEMPVLNISDELRRVKSDQFANVENTDRAPGGSFNRGTAKYDYFDYRCTERSWEEQADNVDAKIHGEAMAQELATTRVAGVLHRRREVNVAAAIFNTSTFANAGTTEWDTSGGKPIDDSLDVREIIRKKNGRYPNFCLMSATVFKNLATNAQIIDRIKYVSGEVVNGMLSVGAVAALLQVPQLIVAGAIKNANGEGLAFNGSDIWDDEYVFWGINSQSLDLKIPQIGKTFVWNTNGLGDMAVMDSYEEPQTDSTIIRGREWADENIFNPDAGYLLSNITT